MTRRSIHLPTRLQVGGLAVFIVLGLFGSLPAMAWGPSGHRLVCEIAFQELRPTAKAAVVALLSNDSEFTTFSASCNWADNPRKRAQEHYINVPRHFTYIGNAECRVGNVCLFSAIRNDVEILRRQPGSPADKLDALKFLGHWVGDIHQPLHVSFKDDKGGNDIIEAPEPPCDGHLHRVWDSCILEERIIKGRQIGDVAKELRDSASDDDRLDWIDSTVVDWADESFKITRRGDVAYCFESTPGTFCKYDSNNGRLDSGEPKRTFVVDENYLNSHADRVRTQILKAGVRLGALLNEIFDPEVPPE
ncbi:MAG TPA: S1/P1 nuclease [Thermoanaerobaculia bacterium]